MTDPPASGRLVSLHPAVHPHELALEAARYTLGRAAQCDATAAIPTVSRLHAVIERRGDGYWLSDAGSANGTFVAGGRIAASRRLADGETIGLGGPEPLLRFLLEAPTLLREAAAAALPAPARLHFDPRQLAFTVDGRPLSLPPTQLRLLHHLTERAWQLCPRANCAEAVWGRPYDPALDRDALDKIVSKLRARLAAADPALSAALHSRRGEGYMWVE
jgi:DNA-binding response OmpR family regulator